MRTRFTSSLVVAAAGCLVLGLTGRADASTIGFTSRAAFDTATTGQTVTNFDALSGGDTIATGGAVGGVTFTYLIPGFSLEIEDGFASTSDPNSLGTTGDGVFIAGDSFTMTFATPVKAVGLFVIAGDILEAGDFHLATAGGGVDSSALADRTVLDGTPAFFLGLTDAAGFTTATLTSSSAAGADFFFNVDDIVTASDLGTTPVPTPEPSTVLLLITGGGMALRRLRRVPQR